MNPLKKALQQTLDALKHHQQQTRPIAQTDEAIEVATAALALPNAEPAGWLIEWHEGKYAFHKHNAIGDYRVFDINATSTPLSAIEQPAIAPAAAQWQPIETAPKDGKEVVLAVKSRAGIRHGVLVGHFMNGGHCIEDHAPINRGWYFWNGCMFDEASKPTLWMPLPHHPEWAKDGWQANKQGSQP